MGGGLPPSSARRQGKRRGRLSQPSLTRGSVSERKHFQERLNLFLVSNSGRGLSQGHRPQSPQTVDFYTLKGLAHPREKADRPGVQANEHRLPRWRQWAFWPSAQTRGEPAGHSVHPTLPPTPAPHWPHTAGVVPEGGPQRVGVSVPVVGHLRSPGPAAAGSGVAGGRLVAGRASATRTGVSTRAPGSLSGAPP